LNGGFNRLGDSYRKRMLKHLNPREKLILAMGLAAMVVALFVYWAVFPLLDRRERSERQALAREKELREMVAYQNEYEQQQKEQLLTADILAKRTADFSLFSFLDQLAGTTGIKKNIVYMKPSSIRDAENQYSLSRVEIKLDEVNLDQVSRFLYRIETSPNLIVVPRLSIKQTKQEGGFLEAVLQVETLGK
jgi:general secretion pathway protein M